MKRPDFNIVSTITGILSTCALLLALTGCLKEDDYHEKITLTGTLLESTSHPVPVSGYILYFYQDGTADNLGSGTIGASSSTSEAVTHANGYFKCRFLLGTGSSTLGINPGTNHSLISTTGDHNSGAQIYWQAIATQSQNLDTVYLYKKIHRAIISIGTSAGLVPTDTLHIYVNTLSGYQDRMVTGLSVPGAGGVAVIDTVPDVIFTGYDVVRHAYLQDITVIVNGDLYNRYKISGDEHLPDEDEKAYGFIIQ